MQHRAQLLAAAESKAPSPAQPLRRAAAGTLGNQARLRRLAAPRAPPSGLRIGAADDPLEREADAVADRVMRMPAPPPLQHAADRGTLRRACAACEEEALRREPAASFAGAAAAPPLVGHTLRAAARPLDPAARAFFEPRFGRDFSAVRVHDDAGAAASARSVDALAYTVASDIVFDAGQYRPHDPEGRRLLAHELAHVVQQGGAAPSSATAAPTLRRASAPLLQRKMRKGCFAPSLVVDVATASAFGTVAETMIEADYIALMGGTPFATVFLDNPLGPMSYVAFLAAHHPSLDITLLAAQIGFSGGVLVPDILDTRGAQEFYDVKPDSVTGRAAGRAKLAAIDAFMTFNHLPYTRGAAYTPTPSLPIPLGGAALAAAITLLLGPTMVAPLLACGLPIATLAPKRAASGLLLYELCIEADIDCYLKVVALEMVIAIIILAILLALAGGVPLPVPAPVPVPVPIPA